MPPYKAFKIRHPDYDSRLWSKCRAFYAGGDRLLGDKHMLQEVFPPHLSEASTIYAERCKRAFYIPYAGEIINSICAGLFAEPLNLRSEPEIKDDEFYAEFPEDVSPPGGRTQTLNDLLKEQIGTALLCRRAWTLVDLPSIPPDMEMPETLMEEDGLGLRNAYAVSIDPEMVLDWEMTEDGALEWVLVMHRSSKRDGLMSDRSLVVEDYTLYTPDSWERYRAEYVIGKEPGDDDEIPLLDSGQHSFGKVPLLMLELPEGLWAMGKVLPIAIAHMNLRNALSWAEYKSLFPVLASFKQGIDMSNPITEDPDRDVNQVLGQGYMFSAAAGDDLRYVGPDSGPFTAAMQDLNNLRDEMHRVLHQMAQSVDNSGAALQRSADSKQVDQQSTAIILRALGQILKEHVVEVMELVQRGRGDKEVGWRPEGMEKYDEISVSGLLEQAEVIDTVSIPSATFKQLWTYNLARRILGDNAEEEDLENIRKELEENVTNEQFMPLPEMGEMPPPNMGEDEDDDEPVPPKPPGNKPMFSSGKSKK